MATPSHTMSPSGALKDRPPRDCDTCAPTSHIEQDNVSGPGKEAADGEKVLLMAAPSHTSSLSRALKRPPSTHASISHTEENNMLIPGKELQMERSLPWQHLQVPSFAAS